MLLGYPHVACGRGLQDRPSRFNPGRIGSNLGSHIRLSAVRGRCKGFKLACAQTKAVLLEPIVKLQVTVPSAAMGDVIGDINSRRGRISGTDSEGDSSIVNAYVPLSEVLEYESKLKSMTQGKGTFTMTIDHLEICPPMVQDKVIKDSGFKATEDED